MKAGGTDEGGEKSEDSCILITVTLNYDIRSKESYNFFSCKIHRDK